MKLMPLPERTEEDYTTKHAGNRHFSGGLSVVFNGCALVNTVFWPFGAFSKYSNQYYEQSGTKIVQRPANLPVESL